MTDEIQPGDEARPESPAAGEVPCEHCGGRGRLDDGTPCPDCGGTGKVIEAVGGG